MKKKMKSSHYGGNEQNGRTYAANSSSLEMMSQLRIFTSKSKVRFYEFATIIYILVHFYFSSACYSDFE